MPAIWSEQLSAAERAALHPPAPDAPDRRPDVLVVGGGAIGLAVAVACRRAGLGRVVVLEREARLAGAASGSNAGAIAPDMHLLTDSPEFVAFGRYSRQLYRDLDAEWDGALGLWPARWLNVFPPGTVPAVTRQAPAQLAPPPPPPAPEPEPEPDEFEPLAGTPRGSRPRTGTGGRSHPAVPPRDAVGPDGTSPQSPPLDRPPPEFQLLDAAAVAALEPDVRVPDGGSALLVDGQSGVNPQRLAGALAGRAGQVVTGVAMLDVTMRGDRIVTVRTTAGDITPGAVVVATGLVPPPWSAGVPQRWIKGHMAAIAPGPWRLGSVLAGPLGGGAPIAGGAIVCGGTFDEDDHTPDVRPEAADRLAADLAAVLPAAAAARITHRWCCFRPHVEGRQPVVDRLPGVANGWFAGGHFTTGIMMAAGTGAAVATWLTTGRRPELVRAFGLPLTGAGRTASAPG